MPRLNCDELYDIEQVGYGHPYAYHSGHIFTTNSDQQSPNIIFLSTLRSSTNWIEFG